MIDSSIGFAKAVVDVAPGADPAVAPGPAEGLVVSGVKVEVAIIYLDETARSSRAL